MMLANLKPCRLTLHGLCGMRRNHGQQLSRRQFRGQSGDVLKFPPDTQVRIRRAAVGTEYHSASGSEQFTKWMRSVTKEIMCSRTIDGCDIAMARKKADVVIGEVVAMNGQHFGRRAEYLQQIENAAAPGKQLWIEQAHR